MQGLLVNWQKTFGLKLIESDRFHANVGIGANFCNGVSKFSSVYTKVYTIELKIACINIMYYHWSLDNYLHIIFVFCLNYFVQLSRILWGLAFDKIGYKKCCIIIGICVTIGISSLPLLLFLGKKCQGTRKNMLSFY